MHACSICSNKRFHGHNGPTLCPSCGAPDSDSHTLLRYTNPRMNRMHISRHNEALSICGEEISKGALGPYIVTMDACG
eukprot:299879-Pelagomonas_calceolata.AAC.1